jgi:ketosteroid isomerase-like protein
MKNKMKILNGFALIALLCLLLNSCTQGPVDVTGKIDEANKALMAAYEKGDANALAGFYTADAKMLPANMPALEGPQAIVGFFGVVKDMGIKKLDFQVISAQSYGDIAIEEGKYALYVDGGYVADQGKYIVTWKNDGGKWKVHRDIWTTNNPAPVQRAAVNDSVLIVINYIKADKVAQFEDFYKNYLAPAATEYNAEVKKSVRMQKPVGQNKDGTYTYLFLMDPYISSFNYDISVPLNAKYGEEKAGDYVKMYLDCLKDGSSSVLFVQETDW